jgi:dolichol-phosphate mannosyltransferase
VAALVRPAGDPWRLDGVDVRRLELDLRDAPAVERAFRELAPDRVYHLAAHGAYSWQADPRPVLESTLLGTAAVLHAAVRTGVGVLVHAGSSSEYGLKDHAPTEDEPLEPGSVYAVGKAAATLLCGQVARERGLRAVTLRLYSVYGPWEDPRRFVPTLVARALAGELPPLVEPETARDFVHVDDAVDAFLLAAAADVAPGAVFNIGSGVQTTIRDAVETARRVFDVAAEPSWGSMQARSWDTSVWVADAGRARAELGWSAATPLDEGFRRTAAWLRESGLLEGRYALR